MSVEIPTVEFERRSAFCADLEDDPPYTVHGVALGAGDVTVGQSGIKKLWPAEELRRAAETLEGTNLVEDHDNSSRGVVGEVTKAGYKEGVGVIYEAELFDEQLAEKVDDGLLEVSIRGTHADVDQMEETENGAKIAEDITFENLSIVPTGAAPSNTIEMGEAEELSVAQLSAMVASLETELEPGMWVKWGDKRGIIVSPVEGEEVEVDVYEKQDDKWRSIGETEMVDTGELDQWDVDEDNIGPRKDDSDEDNSDEEENAALAQHDYSDGDWVMGNSSGGTWHGKIEAIKTSGQFDERIDGDVTVEATEDNPAALIEIYRDGEATGEMVAHRFDSIRPWDGPDSEENTASLEKRYDDYPEAASENAQMAIDAREETGNPNNCGTWVGWMRANQLANNEGLTREQVGKMASFERHRQNSEMTEEKGRADCGWMMWKAWGGDEGIAWAQEKMDQIREENASSEEMAKQHHKKAAEMIPTFLEKQGNSDDTYISAFIEWADNEKVVKAVDEYIDQGGSLHDGVGELEDWLDSMLSGDDEAEMATHDMNPDTEDDREAEDELGTTRVEGEEREIHSDADRKDLMDQEQERFIDSEIEELQNYEFHEVTYDGSHTGEWNEPNLEDFLAEMDTDAESWDDLTESQKEFIASHYLISSSGFPPQNFGDLKLPIVEPDGRLSENALLAVKGGHGAQAVDGLSDEMEDRIIEYVNGLGQRIFNESWDNEEENAPRRRTVDDTGREQGVRDVGPVGISLDLIDKYLRIEDNHERDTVDSMLSWTIGSTDLPTETIDDLRAASSTFLDQTAGTDTFDGITVEQFRDWLLMQGNPQHQRQPRQQRSPDIATPVHVLTGDDLHSDDAGASKQDAVLTTIPMTDDEIEEKLAELNDPVAVEQSDLEELQDKADRFEEMSNTLESLKERTDILDQVDRDQVEELAESEDPVVIESDEHESLREEAQQVKKVYASALAEEMDAFSAEELVDRFEIEELREKYEDVVGDLEDELSGDPEPRSGDPDEEELEERASEDGETTDEEELIQQKQEELRENVIFDD